MKPGRRRIAWWTWARRCTALAFLALLVLGNMPWFSWFKGSTSATTIFGVIPLADPLAALEVMLASRNAHWELLLGAGVLVVVAIMLGPIFCGWVCPLGLLLDLNGSVRARLLGRLRIRANSPSRIRYIGNTRYFVMGGVLGFTLIAGLPAFQTLSPINLIGWSLMGSPSPGIGLDGEVPVGWALWSARVMCMGGIAWLLIGLIALLDWALPRFWCRALCPLGAFYSLVGRLAPLRVRINPALAGRSRCNRCTYSCPMGIAVMHDYTLAGKRAIDHPDCTRCGNCIDTCPTGVLWLGFRGRPASPSPPTSSCTHCDSPPVMPDEDNRGLGLSILDPAP